ncbi:MAG: polyphosphate kinase 1 [Acidobacteria bacterium]|nr:polyphosphate kinase 1 [Acidobacteriota bacterium]
MTDSTTQPKTPTQEATADLVHVQDLEHPSLYINREISWLAFNERVLAEALDPDQPLLERVKFVSIFASNLDEFFMIRVSGLRQQLRAGVVQTPPDGMTASEQLAAIRRGLLPQMDSHFDCWGALRHELDDQGIHVLAYDELKKKQRKLVRSYFKKEIFPALTPLAFDPGHPFPHISNLSMNLAALVRVPDGDIGFARVKLPGFFPRLLRLPSEEGADERGALGLEHDSDSEAHYIWMEDVIADNLDLLFPGLEVVGAYPFRVTRDADQDIEEDEAGDLLTSIQENLRLRHFGSVVRLEIDAKAPADLREVLVQNLGLAPYQVYAVPERVGLADVMELCRLDRPELKDEPFSPAISKPLSGDENIFDVIARGDRIVYHPYDSFQPVVDFVRAAASDPHVLAIKQTLYRAGQDSPVVHALRQARENGKQVAALIELKARFDEANNIVWARALENAGVHVVYGVLGLKTHAKMCLVVRREEGRVVHYLHVSTGNYNATTARIYTDVGFFTANPKLCGEAARLFNALTGYSAGESYEHLLVAPGSLRRDLLDRIEREQRRQEEHGDGYLAFKMNALVDSACIQALYRASQAGVRIDLQVRGICCLRPGLPGVSENIRVTSLVGRFLEHPRIYYFRNGGEDEVLMGSADLMPRNLDHRVEVLFPVRDAALRRSILEDILQVHLRDTENARSLSADGEWEVVDAEAPFDSQQWMIDHARGWSR